jgi:hypothetical protein
MARAARINNLFVFIVLLDSFLSDAKIGKYMDTFVKQNKINLFTDNFVYVCINVTEHDISRRTYHICKASEKTGMVVADSFAFPTFPDGYYLTLSASNPTVCSG